MERKVIVIVGPTCSGKTSLSIQLAKFGNTEIISADSRQLYKLLNIGTATPDRFSLNEVKHHFIDYLNPDENYNISKFETESLQLIEKLFSENKIPIAVGGSGLYIRAMIDGVFNTVDTDDEFREELSFQREKFGNEFIYNRLKNVDPLSASKMLPQNWKRVMRALEVFYLTGKPIWEFQENYQRENDIEFIQYGLNWPREILYKNIEERVDAMILDGLIDETKNILGLGYSQEINALNTVGYKEIISYLRNEITLDRAIELIKRNTRRYAKRQMTWFRKDDRIKWEGIENYSDLELIVKRIYELHFIHK